MRFYWPFKIGMEEGIGKGFSLLQEWGSFQANSENIKKNFNLSLRRRAGTFYILLANRLIETIFKLIKNRLV
jgi:hypothetical protein